MGFTSTHFKTLIEIHVALARLPHNEHGNILAWLWLQKNGNVNFWEWVEWLLGNQHRQQVISSKFTVSCHSLHKWNLKVKTRDENISTWSKFFVSILPLQMTWVAEFELSVHIVQDFWLVVQKHCRRLERIAVVFSEEVKHVHLYLVEAWLATNLTAPQLRRHKHHLLLPGCNVPSAVFCCSSTHEAAHISSVSVNVRQDQLLHETALSTQASRVVSLNAPDGLRYLSVSLTAAVDLVMLE